MFDDLIFKEGEVFYIDTSLSQDHISIEIGDNIKFTHNKKSYLGKITEGKYSYDKIYSILILKEF
jgi:hypothetical protein